MLSGVLFLLIAGSVAAADETVPVVDLPEDIPGADEVAFPGEIHDFDASGSTDDTGIVAYTFEFMDGLTPVTLKTVTGKAQYTFVSYGSVWVTVKAWDAAGNMGIGYYSIDVAEKVTSDLEYQDGTFNVPHSMYLVDADLNIDNAQVNIAEGSGGLVAEGEGAPDMFGESLTPEGDLEGHWEPYSYSNYWKNGNSQYGQPSFDTSTKFSGDGSIKISGGTYNYGWEYHFNEKQDLTKFDTLTFWRHTDRSTDATYMYYIYFYGDWGYSSTYGYIRLYSGVYQQGGYTVYHGWYAYTVRLDFGVTGDYYNYNMNDLSSVAVVRFYSYNHYTNNQWIDHVGFSNTDYKDDITESTNPGGDMAGYWSGFSGLSTNHLVGSYSLYQYLYSGSTYTFYYNFYNPQDLSMMDGLRFYIDSTRTSYWYYWDAWHMWVNDAYGHTAYFQNKWSQYFYYGYGDWFGMSLPWGDGPASISDNFDWTAVTRVTFGNFRVTSYSASFYLDGLEWYQAAKRVVMTEDVIPVTIYVDGGDTTITGSSTVAGTGEQIGARIMTDGGMATIQDARFDNIWYTDAPCADNGVDVFGGIEVYGDAVIDHVTFTNCLGPGLALFDGSWNLDESTIDLGGTSIKAKGSPKIIMGVTDRSTGNFALDISGWTLENSPSGTGLMFMARGTSASITVDIHDNNLDNNDFAGLIISNTGGLRASPLASTTTADLDVTVRDQVIEGSGSYGIMYYAGGGSYAPNVWGTLTVDNVTVRNSGDTGMLVWMDAGYSNLNGMYMNSVFEENDGSGIQHSFSGFFGAADIEMHNITAEANSANGMDFITMMQPYNDGNGNVISPVANVNILVNTSFFTENDGWGIVEDISGSETPEGGMMPPWTWTGPTRTTLWYNMTVQYSQLAENTAGGFMSFPEQGWYHADLVANHDFNDCNIIENRGPAVYLEPNHDMAGGGGTIADVYNFLSLRINDNGAGIEQYLGYENRGYYSELHISECQFVDNNDDAITVYSSWSSDGTYRWGNSMVLGAMVYVDSCTMNTPVSFFLEGADDSGGADWMASMGVFFTNNNVDLDSDAIPFVLNAYPYCEDFVAMGEIYGNTFLRGYPGDGYNVMLFGGSNLEMDFTIRDERIRNAMGTGLNVQVGTLVPSTSPHQVFGTFTVENLTIQDPKANGINFTVEHRNVVGGSSRGILLMDDVIIDGVINGINAVDVDGIIYDSVIRNNDAPAVVIRSSIFDFFSCDVGAVDNTNILVRINGAARMWFDVDVDVKWASGALVMGAVVSMQDNTWATIAVDTVDAPELLSMGYVNSYTILPDSVYSKSPFLLTGTYLGLTTERTVDVDADQVIDLILVDDVLPRLTVNEPMDGTKQRETSLSVRGSAWDMHSGLNQVLLSIDDFNWYEATGSPEFEYTFDTVPEGNLLLRVKAVDHAGNEQARFISLLIDATPPPIVIIEPRDDMFSTNEPMLNIIGITEMGASVFVNNELLEMEHTLFSTTLQLAEGSNEVRVMAMDRLGNSDVHVIYVTLDTIPPPLMVISPAPDSVVGEESISVTGQTEPTATVHIGERIVSNLNGVFSGTVQLTSGPNVIIVTAVDGVGNQRVVRVPVTSDTIVPWLQLASPIEGEVFGFPGIVVNGWVEGGSTVHVNDQPVEVSNGFFTTTVMGSEGENSIFVTVTDQAGNEMTDNVNVWFDTTAPTIVLTTPSDGEVTSEGAVEVTGQLLWDEREGFRDISLQISGEFAPFAADGEFRVHYDLVEGTNPLIIEATDDVGNSASLTVVVVMDSKAPFLLIQAVPTFNHPLWNKAATYNALVYIDGMTEPGAMVTVDGSSVIVDESGHFNVSILLDSVPKDSELVQRTVVVVATDMAGNDVEETVDIYRLAPEEEDPGFSGYESAQYWVLFLSIVILVVAIVAAAFLWRRVGLAEEEEYYEGYDQEEV